MSTERRALGMAIAILLIAGRARAGGFYVPEIGGRAVGMAGAVTAAGADPSTIFHNPAGLTGVPRGAIELGGDLVLPDVTYYRRPARDPGTGSTIHFDRVANTNRVAAVPFLGATFDTRRPDLAVGAALYVPFGATLDFPTGG